MAVAVRQRAADASPSAAGEHAARAPFWTALVVCAALAAISAAVLPTVPSYDPWSWIVWGREVFDPHLSFTVGGGPSWKPLPVIFTAVYGLFGAAAPTVWVITARTGGLMAFVAAYRLAARLVAESPVGAGSASARTDGSWLRGWPVLAGVLAAIAVALTQQWAYYMFRGTSEPLLVGTSLWAVDRHLVGRHRSAFLLAVVTSLMRPEAWPFTLLYALWIARREGFAPRTVVLLGLGLFAIPFFWFVPPWIGTGQPFLAATHAADYNGHLGSSPFVTVVHRGEDLQVLPALVFALIACALAWRRRRGGGRLVLGIAAAAAAWWVLVIAMTLDGYPGLERFYLPAAGLICVLGGVGLVWVAQLVRELVPAGRPGGRGAAVAGIATALVLVGVSVPFTLGRVNDTRAAEPIARSAVDRLNALTTAVAAVGGHRGVFPCHSSYSSVNHGVQTALAWKLHVTLDRVGTRMINAGVMFVGPHDSIDGGPPPINSYLNRIKLIKQVGPWKMYRVYRAGHLTSCVGG